MGKAIVGEDGIGGVAEARAYAQQQAYGGHGGVAAHDAADQRTAREGQRQRQQLPLCQGRLPQQGAHQHHEGWGQIQQDTRHRQGAVHLAVEVGDGQTQHADQARCQKDGQMLQPDTEHLPVEQGEHHRQQHKADEVTDEHAAPDGHARLAQHAVKQADEAPAGRAQNDVQIGDGLFHGLFLVSGESWHSSDQIRPALQE